MLGLPVRPGAQRANKIEGRWCRSPDGFRASPADFMTVGVNPRQAEQSKRVLLRLASQGL
jgi:hypothetical protein